MTAEGEKLSEAVEGHPVKVEKKTETDLKIRCTLDIDEALEKVHRLRKEFDDLRFEIQAFFTEYTKVPETPEDFIKIVKAKQPKRIAVVVSGNNIIDAEKRLNAILTNGDYLLNWRQQIGPDAWIFSFYRDD